MSALLSSAISSAISLYKSGLGNNKLSPNHRESGLLCEYETEACRAALYAELRHILPSMSSRKENNAATLVNTVDGIEAEYVKYLEESTGKPMWNIASPLYKLHHWIDNVNESECICWLNAQKENSILYMSFGGASLSILATILSCSQEKPRNRPGIFTFTIDES